MRVFAIIAISAASLLLPALASADPAPVDASAPQASQSAPAPSATQATPSPQQPGVAPGTSPAGEHVVVNATAVSDSDNVNLDEVVCRSQPPATGTRLGGGRECHTVRQWNDRMRQQQRILQQQQNTSMYHSGG